MQTLLFSGVYSGVQGGMEPHLGRGLMSLKDIRFFKLLSCR